MKKKKKTTRIKRQEQEGNWLGRLFGGIDPERKSFYFRMLGRFSLLLLFGGVVVSGFYYMERYVEDVSKERQVSLTVEFPNPPKWASPQLIEEICLSSGIRSDDFLLDKELTAKWSENLAQNPWVKTVNQVHKFYTGVVKIDCELRQPIASVQGSGEVYYLDEEGVVLPAVKLVEPYGHVLSLRGVTSSLPKVGQKATGADITAGLQVLSMIRQVDQKLSWDEQLWNDLAVLDLNNYGGRVNQMESHLTLLTKNKTPIYWGVDVDRTRSFYEAPVKVKLENLYRHALDRPLDQYPSIDLRSMRKEKADVIQENG